MDPSDPAYAGQKDYKPFLLTIYDAWVLGFMSRAVWRFPIQPAVDLYRQGMGKRHLDIGPGSGYFLDIAMQAGDVELTILDPNPHVLDHVTRRLAPRSVTAIEADVLKPLPVKGPFDSAGLSAVLHCLPGPQANKGRAIRNIAAVLAPDGVLFGITVLGFSEPHSRAARATLRAFNRQGGFDNRGDTADGLREILAESFRDVEIEVIGSIATFRAQHPR